MTICCKCVKFAKAADIKSCSKCNATFHYQCLGIQAENFAKESKAHKSSWKCPECKLADKNKASPYTSGTRAASIDTDTFATTNIADFIQNFDKKLEDSLSRLYHDITRDISADSTDTRTNIQELTESINYMSDKYEQLKGTLIANTKIIGDLQQENQSLRSQVGDLRSEVGDLQTRLSQFDQQSRECNLEIQCVPEHSSENLKTIVQQFASTVGYNLPDNELVNYHRVAKLNRDSGRPRSIVIKLSRPLVRDSLIAATKTYNKTHPSEKLNSSHLGIADKDKKPVYVCENLSPANKQLHAAARKVAKEKKFDFVWVRNGKIFMRKNANSKSFVVKDLAFLNSV